MGPSHDRVSMSAYEKRDIPTRRMSTEERIQQILSQNKPVTADDYDDDLTEESTPADSAEDPWIAMRASIMEGVMDTVQPVQLKAPVVQEKPQLRKTADFLDGMLDVSDSLELSAADLEVGAYAARRNAEKSSERRRR